MRAIIRTCVHVRRSLSRLNVARMVKDAVWGKAIFATAALHSSLVRITSPAACAKTRGPDIPR